MPSCDLWHSPGQNGVTALMAAIRFNKTACMFELIVHGANIEYRNKVLGGTVVGESV